MRRIIITILLISIPAIVMSQDWLPGYEKNWHQWRGPYANGVAHMGDPPIEFGENKNVQWKTEIPGTGHATPIIWEDQIILLSAIKTDQEIKPEDPAEDQEQNDWMEPVATNFVHEFAVISVNRNDGRIQWQTTVREELPHSHTHRFGSWASNSPVTDGDYIYAYFGSHGLYCLNMDGELVWERDFGQMQKRNSFGEGSSPVLHNDKLILLRDHEGQSSLHILNKITGKDIQTIERDERSSWTTPLILEYDGKTQIITPATNKYCSYDLATGDILWEGTGLTFNVIPCPVVLENTVYLMSGFRGNALFAVDISKASGDITNTDAIVWEYDINTPYTPSPVLLDDKLYFLKANNGYLTCLDANSGKEFYGNQHLEGIQRIFTSPIGVEDRLYIVGTNGTVIVVKHGPEFEVLAKNTLDDNFYASPVAVNNTLYLRGAKFLYCISAGK